MKDEGGIMKDERSELDNPSQPVVLSILNRRVPLACRQCNAVNTGDTPVAPNPSVEM